MIAHPHRTTFTRLADSAAHLERQRKAIKGCVEHGTFAYECQACIAALRGPPRRTGKGFPEHMVAPTVRLYTNTVRGLQEVAYTELVESMGLV